MASDRQCPGCGNPIATDAPAGICAACLMQAGLDPSRGGTAPTIAREQRLTYGGGFVPPSPDELSSYFPQMQIVRLLGQGGMGAVYLARQTSLDRLVALKIIRPEAAGVAAFAERFAREARALARLNHQNIVGVHDFGSVDIPITSLHGDREPGSVKLYFLTMEYVDGTNLRQLMSGDQLAPAEALAIVPQICEALQFAHDEHVVHRDIKPENILIDRLGRVKIADFGLAKLIENEASDVALTGTHQVMGTPRYMAPEQLEQSRTIDHRADIYSLGVVFYEMLTGELPMGIFEPPSRKVQVDVRLDDVVLRSLAKEPDRRYQHASEIKTDVESVVAGGPVAPSTGSADPAVGEERKLGLPGPTRQRKILIEASWPVLFLGIPLLMAAVAFQATLGNGVTLVLLALIGLVPMVLIASALYIVIEAYLASRKENHQSELAVKAAGDAIDVKSIVARPATALTILAWVSIAMCIATPFLCVAFIMIVMGF